MSQDLDGELSTRRKRMLEAHVAGCASCQQVRRLWRNVGDQFRARERSAPQTAEAVWADVRRAIRTRVKETPIHEDTPGWGPQRVWATAMIVFFVVGATSWLLLMRRAETERTTFLDADASRVEWVETDLPGATPMVYEDAETGCVVIWVVEADHEEDGHAGT